MLVLLQGLRTGLPWATRNCWGQKFCPLQFPAAKGNPVVNPCSKRQVIYMEIRSKVPNLHWIEIKYLVIGNVYLRALAMWAQLSGRSLDNKVHKILLRSVLPCFVWNFRWSHGLKFHYKDTYLFRKSLLKIRLSWDIFISPMEIPIWWTICITHTHTHTQLHVMVFFTFDPFSWPNQFNTIVVQWQLR